MRVKYRWLLPFGHALIDSMLLVAWITLSGRLFPREKDSMYRSAPVQAALFLQEGGSVTWEPANLPPSGPFVLIMSGNLPVGLISAVLRPRASIVRRGHRWDGLWFALQEAIAFPSWYLIGFWIDTYRFRLGKVMIAYLAVRFLVALTGFYDVGMRIQVLFWLGFVLWLTGLGLSRLIKIGSGIAKLT